MKRNEFIKNSALLNASFLGSIDFKNKMIMKFFFTVLMLSCLFFSAKAQTKVNIIPQPVSLQEMEGYFLLDDNTAIHCSNSNKELMAAANFFAAYVKNISGYGLPVNVAKKQSVRLVIAKMSELGEEGYQLDVSHNAIVITANTKEGIVYGMQTLFQTMPPIRTNAILQIPCMMVTDYPRFKWRGMHLDVSRHFFSTDVIKQYLDLMASYKMNVFHWHLTDGGGWRLEIKKYPKLTQQAAWRVDDLGKPWNWASVQFTADKEKATFGGYYTQQQAMEIVAYAKVRNITVVPEIEMPGHSEAAMAAYPELSCSKINHFGQPGNFFASKVEGNYCAGNEQSFIFLQDVLKEVMNIFPSDYIHIGGDEVDKTSWKKCANCQARMQKEGLKNENELQSYFIKRMEKFIVGKKRKMIGWDEILEGGLAPEATVMSWRGESGGIEAAKMKHEVVMTPGSPCYFDHYQAGPDGEPLAIGGFNTVKKVYDYEPIPKELDATQAKYVLGAQGNVWTEYIATAAHLEYMVLPRMPALAEVLWTQAKNKNWEQFNQRLQLLFKAYDQKGLHYSPGNYTVGIQPISKNGKLMVALIGDAMDTKIVYTTDGTSPTLQSNLYQQPIVISESMTVNAISTLGGKLMGGKPSSQSFVLHKAIGTNVVYTNPVSANYLADGPNSLTDGVRGTTAAGKYWHGIDEKDLVATLDLGEQKLIQSISLGCLQNYKDWIFLPQSVSFEISNDGLNFTLLQTIPNPISVNEVNALIHDFTVQFPIQKVKWIRVSAKNIGFCPKGHSGEGQAAWIFADEIVVK
jgi:hexosaminidase